MKKSISLEVELDSLMKSPELEHQLKSLTKKDLRGIIIKYASITGVTLGTIFMMANEVYAEGDAGEQIRTGFRQLQEVAVAIAEPVLWCYALTACVLMATGKSRDIGWKRLKSVGYSYIAITLLPTIFAFLRWIARLFEGVMIF